MYTQMMDDQMMIRGRIPGQKDPNDPVILYLIPTLVMMIKTPKPC